MSTRHPAMAPGVFMSFAEPRLRSHCKRIPNSLRKGHGFHIALVAAKLFTSRWSEGKNLQGPAGLRRVTISTCLTCCDKEAQPGTRGALLRIFEGPGQAGGFYSLSITPEPADSNIGLRQVVRLRKRLFFLPACQQLVAELTSRLAPVRSGSSLRQLFLNLCAYAFLGELYSTRRRLAAKLQNNPKGSSRPETLSDHLTN
jgi:hypothetical protein